ncbi:MAG: hypothetical protein H6643_13930 [Caldilineaceae bacterium]|nr:hypothetical protein [Caldilineaceae bacterium]
MSGKQKPIDIEPVLQWIRDNSIDGIGPARSMYHSAAAAAGLPSYSSLQLRKWTWPALCKLAGVERRQVGRPPIHTGAQFLRAYPGAVPTTVEEEIDLMKANAEPPRPSEWPLFGIPTRRETFVVPITADTAIRCTRQYYSLR